MKRFYKQASVAAQDSGFAVALDGKPIKTPAGHILSLPTQKLADAITAEWQAQGETIVVSNMPLMQLAATTLDHVSKDRVAMLERLLSYSGTDLLCHFVEEPKRLRELQERLFTPALAWVHRRYDIDLHTTTELMAVEQPELVHERFTRALGALSNWALMGVQTAAIASGSIVLALGLCEKAFTATEVFDAAEVETTYQIEKWGTDIELVKRRNGIEQELKAVERWFELIG
ncbi:MAG: ATPase [Alphaproteobacteria bacterium]|nr:ATPase [Alphaproteobacteria bacterium]